MAAPQTHFVISWVIWRFLSFVIGMSFSIWEVVSIFFWGVLVDIVDHFVSWEYVKDIIFVRIPRFFKGGDVGPPSEDVEVPPCWLHLWPGLIAVCIWTIISWLVDSSFMIWIPFVFWLKHKIIDVHQKNDGTYFQYSFLYPIFERRRVIKKGYPIKPRIEILVGTVFTVLIILFEIYYNFLR